MAKIAKISKAKSYVHRIACAEYDMHGMIEAYGVDFVIALAKAIKSGKINCKESTQRWSAHVSLNGGATSSFEAFASNYFNVPLEDESILDQLMNDAA